MANMRAIRARIKSVESTRQITKSMKMVAASKLRRTQMSFSSLSFFADKCGQTLQEVLSTGEKTENPLLQPHGKREKLCYVLFVGNRGLCGMYNSALVRYLTELAEKDGREAFLVVCGRWGRDVLHGTGLPVRRCFDSISDTPDAAQAQEIADYLKDLYRSGEADEIQLVYQQYRSALDQDPGVKQLLPADIPENERTSGAEYIFEPDAAVLLDNLVELYITNTVHAVLLEAKTGEHSARMTAMTSATDNTDELIEQLNLELNHVRQSAITTEISEIAGGAAALDKK